MTTARKSVLIGPRKHALWQNEKIAATHQSGPSMLEVVWQLCLRFVAAVSASCSGDKSDKEESAGCFGAMGIVGYCCVVRCIEQRF